jgi:hypothetical protein
MSSPSAIVHQSVSGDSKASESTGSSAQQGATRGHCPWRWRGASWPPAGAAAPWPGPGPPDQRVASGWPTLPSAGDSVSDTTNFHVKFTLL